MKVQRRPVSSVLAVLLLAGSTPLMMGGCNQIQGEVVTAVVTAARSIADAAVNLFFDQYLPN